MDVVCIADGKRGHENQSLGLIEALARLCDVRVQPLRIEGRGRLGALRMARTAPRGAALVVGAGHATHLPLLLCARRAAARSVVLMRPTLPRRLFDLCIVPEHDGVIEDAHTLVSLGALNRVRAVAEKTAQPLVLVGGPSRHNHWDEALILSQINEVATHHESIVIATSRRTPESTESRLAQLSGARLVSFASADRDWLTNALPRAGTVWVTRDSVSMAYEAATAGAALGLLEVGSLRRGRTRSAIEALHARGRALRFEEWRAGRPLTAPDQPLDEAARCAKALLERWPDLAR